MLRALSPAQALWDSGEPLHEVRSLLTGTPDGDTPMAVCNFMFKCMLLCLQEHDREDLVELVPPYVLFRISLGMLQPWRIERESTLAGRACLANFSHALVWPLELGLRTPTLQCGHLSGPSRTRRGFFDFKVGGHDGPTRAGCM